MSAGTGKAKEDIRAAFTREAAPDQPSATVTLRQAISAELAEDRHILELQRLAVQQSDEARYTFDERQVMRRRFRPLAQTLAFGTSGLLIFALSFLIPELNASAGDVLGDAEGYLRMLMMFGGGILVFFAWPEYRHIEDTDEDRAMLEEAKDRIARIRR